MKSIQLLSHVTILNHATRRFAAAFETNSFAIKHARGDQRVKISSVVVHVKLDNVDPFRVLVGQVWS